MAVLVFFTLLCSTVLASAAEKKHESFLSLKTLTAELEKNLTSLQAKVLYLEQRDRQSVVEMDLLKRRVSESGIDVSFLVVDIREQQNVPSGGIVQFPTIRHRTSDPEGYGFDTVTGKFRCPLTGTYAFFFHTFTLSCDHHFTLEIMRDSTTLAATFAVTNSGVCNQAMSASVITPCSRGQYIYVRNPYGALVIDSYTNGITHFTGVLINL